MGIDIQNCRLLNHCHQYGSFKETLTIGRQGLYINEEQLKYLLEDENFSSFDSHCEKLFINYYGSTKVDSIDYSNYEQCNIIHDMNLPIDQGCQKYDTIFDGGTLEHIFNVNQALKNISLLCKPGGQIIHSLPANNQCGHGFWQFSPELFLSLYSKENGYSNTEVYIASVNDFDNITQINENSFSDTGRQMINIPGPSYVWVRTVLEKNNFTHSNIQQFDYKNNYWK